MHRTIFLWDTTAPYTDYSPAQAQPSIVEFTVTGAKTAVVVCPGGGYEMKSAHEGAPIAEMLNASGIAAYVLDYRVKPCHYLAPLTDALRAIRTLRAMGYAQVGILGFSAGGHLTCTAATKYDVGSPDAADPIECLSSRPDFFVPCYPVVSFVSHPHEGSYENLLGNFNQREKRVEFSCELNVTRDTPPAFIWHTANDELVPVENSLMLASALSAACVAFELHIYPDGQHGLGLAEENPPLNTWTKLCTDFIHALCADK